MMAFIVLTKPGIRDAISAVGGHRLDPPLSAPATPEAILRAIAAVRAPATSP